MNAREGSRFRVCFPKTPSSHFRPNDIVTSVRLANAASVISKAFAPDSILARDKIQPRCARRCVANRPSWEEHLSGVLAGLLARRVVRYDVDFTTRTCTYFGCEGEKYIEDYPAVAIDNFNRRERADPIQDSSWTLLPPNPSDSLLQK
jgi:hypothetical protein